MEGHDGTEPQKPRSFSELTCGYAAAAVDVAVERFQRLSLRLARLKGDAATLLYRCIWHLESAEVEACT